MTALPVDAAQPVSWRISAAGVTHVGKVRSRNEDAFVVMDLDHQIRGKKLERRILGRRGALLVVADGMGGAAGGDLASMMATEAVVAALAQTESCAERVLELALADAHEVVREAAGELGLKGMGTTLTVVHVCTGVAHIAHVGDSRAYLARGGELIRLTRDDTVVQEAIDAGKMSPEEARRSPMRHLLAEALGAQSTLRPSLGEIALAPGDRLVLCTDGLVELVDDAGIHRIVESSASCREAADRLVRTANERGGLDNVTVVVASIDGAGSGTYPVSR